MYSPGEILEKYGKGPNPALAVVATAPPGELADALKSAKSIEEQILYGGATLTHPNMPSGSEADLNNMWLLHTGNTIHQVRELRDHLGIRARVVTALAGLSLALASGIKTHDLSENQRTSLANKGFGFTETIVDKPMSGVAALGVAAAVGTFAYFLSDAAGNHSARRKARKLLSKTAQDS